MIIFWTINKCTSVWLKPFQLYHKYYLSINASSCLKLILPFWDNVRTTVLIFDRRAGTPPSLLPHSISTFFIHFSLPPFRCSLWDRWVENTVYFCTSAGIVDWQLLRGLSWQQFPVGVGKQGVQVTEALKRCWLNAFEDKTTAEDVATYASACGGCEFFLLFFFFAAFFSTVVVWCFLVSCSSWNFVMCCCKGWEKVSTVPWHKCSWKVEEGGGNKPLHKSSKSICRWKKMFDFDSANDGFTVQSS